MIRVIEQAYEAGRKQAAHAHAEHTISIVLGGSLRERVGRREVVARPLSIVGKPPGTEHANEFGDRVLMLRLQLDPDTSRECLRAAGTLSRWAWFMSTAAVPRFFRLLHAHRSGAPAEQVHELAVDAVASLETPKDSASQHPPRWIEIVRSAVDDGATSVAELASTAGVHPVYLARQFRRWYGHSITDYVRGMRVQCALVALSNSQVSISAAAYDAGFADHSHMCRVLKASTGVTPRTYRSILAAMV